MALPRLAQHEGLEIFHGRVAEGLAMEDNAGEGGFGMREGMDWWLEERKRYIH